jgi:MFS family permease
MTVASLTTRYPAFSSRDFRLLWLGQFISNIGSQMQMVALNWQIYVLTHSAVALGIIGLVRVIPILIFSLFGGIVADRYNRKLVMMCTQISLLIFSVVLTLATFLNHITPFIIYTMTALATIALAFDTPSRQALIPNLVKKENLQNALTLNSIMYQVSTVVGPTIAGILIGKLGIGYIYGFNALSFLAVLIAVIFIQTSGEIIGEKAAFSVNGILEGIQFIRSRTIIWSTMLLDFFGTFFASATALLPIFAKDILRVGPEGLGLLYASPAIGAIIAGVTLAHFHFLRKEGKVILLSVAVYALGTIIFGLSHNFILSSFGLLLVGLGDNISTIIRNTIRQLTTPDSIRGRMTSINMIFFAGGPQLGEFEAGILASLAGAPFSVVFGGVMTLLVIVGMGIKIPKLRNFDQRTENPL